MCKRKILLLIICFTALCLSAASATADLIFTIDKDAALLFTMQDAYNGASGYTAQLDSGSPYTDPAPYNPPFPGYMQGTVGFIGQLDPDLTGDVFGWMKIGSGDETIISDLSGYDAYQSFVANDNDDYWGAMLYITTSNGTTNTTYYSSGNTSIVSYGDFTEIANHAYRLLTLDLSGVSNLSNVVDIGFVAGGSHIQSIDSDYPSLGDSFHLSVVPVPAAVILGVLGLGVAGLKLRKFA